MGPRTTDLLDRDRLASLTPTELARRGSAKWCRVPGALGASVAEMDFGLPEAITDTLIEAGRRGNFGYFPPDLTERLDQATARYQRDQYGWDVDPGRVHAVGDVIVGLETTIEWFTPPGSPVVVLTPAYMPFLTVPARLHRPVIEVALREDAGAWKLDLEKIADALDEGARLVVLCNPHNPIGKVYREAELHALAEIVERSGARVFADEIHAPLIYPGARHQCYAPLGEHTDRHTITATSASKAWNIPGLKCAQLVLADQDQDTWEQIRHSASRGASNLGAEATITAYREGGPWLAEVMRYLEDNRRLLGELVAEHLPGVRWTPPEGTYLAWLDCRDLGLESSAAAHFLDRAGVSVADGRLCGAAGEGFVRLNYATSAHILEKMLTAMGKSLASS
ncbi:aminotransferase class I/II-fold pyridoxal phosphate-dependent enzyme [Streptomyces sp. SID8361]|uniref:MalY/PatB family protein n=1 Tax=Streptomyces TaxID=1883 RepID=UPI00081EEA56|nr:MULTISPECIES: aminotransferase class I/II-fold pyridoxal phosphate-dependent enzyme [unclassified Streptomyces]AUA17065.1 Cystathionine beta-lyase PatB [Streptomyces sp. M56]MYU12435.1 aminotransferase class I/II-fold pyridoxal phosphate-dependent enzyme [Streptomyces sp. SID8361]MYX55497.1 aminotransferase class I/II-fold pyridoxal phosphate-dependent enzyme [Streptomyces sp. SID8382]SCF91568.1 cystathione beta-lyase [Streptomyces sp. MnatMP-M27]